MCGIAPSKLEAVSSKTYIGKLLKGAVAHAQYANGILIDYEAGDILITAPTMVALQIVIDLWKQWVYRGMSYDSITLEPSFTDARNVSKVNRVRLHITTQEDPKKTQEFLGFLLTYSYL